MRLRKALGDLRSRLPRSVRWEPWSVLGRCSSSSGSSRPTSRAAPRTTAGCSITTGRRPTRSRLPGSSATVTFRCVGVVRAAVCSTRPSPGSRGPTSSQRSTCWCRSRSRSCSRSGCSAPSRSAHARPTGRRLHVRIRLGARAARVDLVLPAAHVLGRPDPARDRRTDRDRVSPRDAWRCSPRASSSFARSTSGTWSTRAAPGSLRASRFAIKPTNVLFLAAPVVAFAGTTRTRARCLRRSAAAGCRRVRPLARAQRGARRIVVRRHCCCRIPCTSRATTSTSTSATTSRPSRGARASSNGSRSPASSHC